VRARRRLGNWRRARDRTWERGSSSAIERPEIRLISKHVPLTSKHNTYSVSYN
jgi:hypothetical protein